MGIRPQREEEERIEDWEELREEEAEEAWDEAVDDAVLDADDEREDNGERHWVPVHSLGGGHEEVDDCAEEGGGAEEVNKQLPWQPEDTADEAGVDDPAFGGGCATGHHCVLMTKHPIAIALSVQYFAMKASIFAPQKSPHPSPEGMPTIFSLNHWLLVHSRNSASLQNS
jgi:hypothetical protein